MSTIFNDLVLFFGIGEAPATFAELIPWLFQVFLAIGLFMFVFGFIAKFVQSFGRGLNRW